MRSFLLSAVMSLAVLGSVLMTDSTAQAQRRGRGGAAGVYVGPRGSGYYNGRGYSNGRYYGNRYYGNRYYGYYGNGYYDTYYTPSYRSSYYYEPSSADRYWYYTSNGWQICKDRYTGEYWYLSNGTWYRWY